MRPLFIASLALLFVSPAFAQDGLLLIGNKGEDTLGIVDLESGQELARIATGPAPHEIAVSPDGDMAAVVAYGGASIDMIDLATRKRVRSIDLTPDQRPHGLLWLADGRIVATTEGSQSIVVIDPDGTQHSIATNAEGSHMVVANATGTLAWVANIRSGSVSVIDLKNHVKLRDIAVGGRPEGIALAMDDRELWVGDLASPRVQVFATDDDARVAQLPVDPVAIRVLASPDGRMIATSNFASGTVTLFDAATRKAVRTITVSGTADAAQVTLLFSPDGQRLYAAETGRDHVAEIDMASGKVLRRIAAGRQGDGLAIAPGE